MPHTSSEQTGDKKTEQEVLDKWHYRRLLKKLEAEAEAEAEAYYVEAEAEEEAL